MPEDRPYTEPAHPQATKNTQQNASLPAPGAPTPTPPAKEKPKRTWGLWLLDTFLYIIINNTSVFLLSLGATYLTNKKSVPNEEGTWLFRKTEEFFNKRGQWLVEKFEATGMSTKSAEMSKMVFFSWADGTALAPVIKLIEDRRESLGRWLDHKMGTEPADDSVYTAEPKQSWGSVLGGRLATCAIVVPTAVLLQQHGLNDKFFYEPGRKFGEKIAKRPNIAKWFGKLDIAELCSVARFEAFYTTVCTVGLYLGSRLIASITGKKHREEAPVSTEASTAPHPHTAPPIATTAVSLTATTLEAAASKNGPGRTISLPPGGTITQRIASSAQHELAASN